MKLLFLGSGSAFTLGGENWQSNMVLESPSGKRLLIDCCGDIRFSLAEQGLAARDIDAIYISHLHADHVGGVEWLGFSTHFSPNGARPALFGSDVVLAELWDHSLRGGMQSIQGAKASISTYFDVRPVAGEGQFNWEGATFQLIRVQHVDDGQRQMLAFGLNFNLNGKNALLTTDTQFTPQHLVKQFGAADVIFHDCETSQFPSTVHAHYNDLKSLPADIRAKTWLYHYQPGSLPDAIADGFLGFVTKGQVFT